MHQRGKRRSVGSTTPILRPVPFVTVYSLLWIYEGALRKWIAPSAGEVLYVARDAITILAVVYLVLRSRNLDRLRWIGPIALVVAALSMWSTMQILLDTVSTSVAVQGIRALAFPLMAAAVIATSISPSSAVNKITNVVLFAAPVQALLTILQVSSPPTGFWNRVGEDVYTELFTANDVVRASGTFTAPIGLTLYASLALALALGHLSLSESRDRRRDYVSLGSLVVVIALSGSRGTLFSCAIVVLAYVIAALRQGNVRSTFARLVGVSAFVVVGYLAVRQALPDVIQSFQTRIESANSSESTANRIVTQSFGYLISPQISSLGDGVGAHSNSGAAVGSTLPWIENEFVRWTTEMGFLGFLACIFRQVAGVALLVYNYRRLSRGHNARWLVVSALVLVLVFGSGFSQASQGGFVALALGYYLSARKAEVRED